MPKSVKCQKKLKHMLEWLEVRLDVGCDKRLVYEYRIEPLKCDRDVLIQEWRLAWHSTADPLQWDNRKSKELSPPELWVRLV